MERERGKQNEGEKEGKKKRRKESKREKWKKTKKKMGKRKGELSAVFLGITSILLTLLADTNYLGSFLYLGNYIYLWSHQNIIFHKLTKKPFSKKLLLNIAKCN